MTTPALSLPLRRRGAFNAPNSSTTRFALHCEPPGNPSAPFDWPDRPCCRRIGEPLRTKCPAFRSSDGLQLQSLPSYLNVEIEFGTFGGLNQIQIVFLGSWARLLADSDLFVWRQWVCGREPRAESSGNSATDRDSDTRERRSTRRSRR